MAHECEDPEVIRRHMDETRTALADKLEALEEHVVGTVQETTANVADTAEKVTDAVGETVDTVKDTVESVREAFDLPLQVERHPWAMVGGAVAVGYLMGRLLPASVETKVNGHVPHAAVAASNGYHEPAQPSYLGELLAPELEKVKALALGAVLGLVRDVVAQAIPPTLEEPARDVMDRVTDKLGGQPVRGPVLADGTSPRH